MLGPGFAAALGTTSMTLRTILMDEDKYVIRKECEVGKQEEKGGTWEARNSVRNAMERRKSEGRKSKPSLEMAVATAISITFESYPEPS